MDWIANMRGPDFLVLYTAVITCVILVCVYAVRSRSASIYSGTMPVPSRPDPYEIAYLRGGEQEVARVAIVSLLDRGFLKLDDKGDLRRTEQAERGLQPLEHAILASFANTWKNPVLAKIVQPFMAPYEEKLRREGLLVDSETKSYARRVALTGCALIGFLDLFKLLAALEKGRRNVGLLIVLGIAGCMAVLAFSTPRRITRRGRAWLKNLQTSFEALRAEPAGATSGISHLPLLVGVFGASALAATAYAPLARQRHGTDTGCGYMYGGSSGSSGSNCGGGDSGGGGDGGGGGCGGCGGGGN